MSPKCFRHAGNTFLKHDVGPAYPALSLSPILSSLALMAQSYKSIKEDFVSNLSGGSIREIICVTAIAPVSDSIDLSRFY